MTEYQSLHDTQLAFSNQKQGRYLGAQTRIHRTDNLKREMFHLCSEADSGQMDSHLLVRKGCEFLNRAVLAAGEVQLVSTNWQDGYIIPNNPTAPILQPHARAVSRIGAQAAAVQDLAAPWSSQGQRLRPPRVIP